MRQSSAHGADRCEEVEGDGARPVLVGDGQVAARSWVYRADIVDDDVEPLEAVDSLVDERSRSRVGTEVDAYGVHPPAVGQLVQLRASVERPGGDEHTLARERPGDGKPDPLARAG